MIRKVRGVPSSDEPDAAMTKYDRRVDLQASKGFSLTPMYHRQIFAHQNRPPMTAASVGVQEVIVSRLATVLCCDATIDLQSRSWIEIELFSSTSRLIRSKSVKKQDIFDPHQNSIKITSCRHSAGTDRVILTVEHLSCHQIEA